MVDIILSLHLLFDAEQSLPGPMCTVIGYGYNFNMTATLDGQLLDWKLPEENDERYPSLIDLRGLSPGPHSLLFNTSNRVDPEGISRITIERAYIDTGLTKYVRFDPCVVPVF